MIENDREVEKRSELKRNRKRGVKTKVKTKVKTDEIPGRDQVQENERTPTKGAPLGGDLVQEALLH